MDHYLTSPTPLSGLLSPNSIPYIIIVINFFIFNLTRAFINKLANFLQANSGTKSTGKGERQATGRKRALIRLFLLELIATCELCADCAELNVIYELHGSLAYGVVLFVLTYLWFDTFGDAHTTPGYLFEDYFLVNGNQLLKTGDTYARFVGQTLAMPMAWRFASLYWAYHLLDEHKTMLDTENCKTSLNSNTLNGLLIEFGCCFLCRLLELMGHKLIESKTSFLYNNALGKRIISLFSSFFCTLLVVLSLEASGGYFNPILASSLEYGCKGINFYQHAIVFWFGPLFGHLLARMIFKRYVGDSISEPSREDSAYQRNETRRSSTRSSKKLARANSRKKRAD